MRLLGFSRRQMLLSFLLESLVLALAGGRYELLARSMAVLKLNCRREDLRRAEDWGPMGVY